MRKKLIFGIVAALVAIGVFLGVLFGVQYYNSDLEDINLMVNTLKQSHTLTENAVVAETKEGATDDIYRIEDTNSITVIQMDRDWKNGQKGMLMWQESEDLKMSTTDIMKGMSTNWVLSLSEMKFGPWMLYKEINMNQLSNLNENGSVLETILAD